MRLSRTKTGPVNVRCKDYFIIKIRYYADEKLLKKSREGGELPKQHYDRAQEWIKFSWDLIKKITGKGLDQWSETYWTDSRKCALDYIEETHGIMSSDGEGCEIFMIPLKHKEIIEWIKENINCHIK